MINKHILIDGQMYLDINREQRTLVPEIIYAPNKSEEELLQIVRIFLEEKSSVFVSRLDEIQKKSLNTNFPQLIINQRGRTAWAGSFQSEVIGTVGLVSAGTSDLAVLEEARSFLNFMGVSNEIFVDVGVASIGRVLSRLQDFEALDVIIVFAGMEGALPSVMGGLLKTPIIAVPTSIGYGVSEGGYAALLSMLSSCSPGILTVNIDNGIGAASAAIRILGIKGK